MRFPKKLSFEVLKVAASLNHGLMLTRTGSVIAFGHGAAAGNNLQEGHADPTLIEAVKDVADIAVGTNHSIILTRSGILYTWGGNHCGQLGLGTENAGKIIPYAITLCDKSNNIRD